MASAVRSHLGVGLADVDVDPTLAGTSQTQQTLVSAGSQAPGQLVAVGCNCSLPSSATTFARRLRAAFSATASARASAVPLVLYPNGGYTYSTAGYLAVAPIRPMYCTRKWFSERPVYSYLLPLFLKRSINAENMLARPPPPSTSLGQLVIISRTPVSKRQTGSLSAPGSLAAVAKQHLTISLVSKLVYFLSLQETGIMFERFILISFDIQYMVTLKELPILSTI